MHRLHNLDCARLILPDTTFEVRPSLPLAASARRIAQRAAATMRGNCVPPNAVERTNLTLVTILCLPRMVPFGDSSSLAWPSWDASVFVDVMRCLHNREAFFSKRCKLPRVAPMRVPICLCLFAHKTYRNNCAALPPHPASNLIQLHPQRRRAAARPGRRPPSHVPF